MVFLVGHGSGIPSSGLRKSCHCVCLCHENCLLWTIPSIPSIFFFRNILFPSFVQNPSGFVLFSPFLFTIRALFVVRSPQSSPKPPKAPQRAPITLYAAPAFVPRRPSTLLLFSTRGLREAEEQALPGRAWSPRSVRATSPFGLARRGKERDWSGEDERLFFR